MNFLLDDESDLYWLKITNGTVNSVENVFTLLKLCANVEKSISTNDDNKQIGLLS